MNNFIESINRAAEEGSPFLFIIDYEMSNPLFFPLDKTAENCVFFSINGFSNIKEESCIRSAGAFTSVKTQPYKDYLVSFSLVHDELKKGNSYLANLTCKTEIETSLTLKEIFNFSEARYRLLYRNEFVVFSPETFIIIEDGKIFTHPMKGTIDAALPDARSMLINDEKEFAEHITVVDLLRNDIGMIASQVSVDSFRYIDRINAGSRSLYQTSSCISGKLPPDWRKNLGTILAALLPAGSVTGAPKKKTVEILQSAEKNPRGYYSGVFGYFDGSRLESAVMIRFIEENCGKKFYRSGGGITVYSDPIREYQEMIEKIYVPFY